MTSNKDKKEEEIIAKGEDISPDHDGGLIKEIIREGINDDDKPLYDDQIFIHYIGREIDGKIFIDSRERDEKFSFSLGKKEVIPAWDIGVSTMKRGEISKFTSIPKYAYGSKGEKKYRSATNVIFEIELIDFQGKDISDENDGTIIRRIFHKGEGREYPNEDGAVQVQLKGKYKNKIFDERTVEFIVGLAFMQNVPLCVERVVYKMLLNEHSQFVFKGKELEGLEKFSIPKDESVIYDITLTKFQRLEEEQFLGEKRKIEQAELLKGRADNLVKNTYYELGIKRYKMSLGLISGTFQDRNDRIKIRQMKIAIESNLSLCYLKLEDYLQCKTHCENVLTLDPKNEKSLFRHGQTHVAFENFEQAIQDFQSVININPSNLAAKQQLEYCQQQFKLREAKQKQSYQTFFKDPSKPGLFDVDQKYEKQKEELMGKNALKSLGLEPVNLDTLKFNRDRQSKN